MTAEQKPVFSINPPIILTMNDEMARQIVECLEGFVRDGAKIPPAVFAFKQTLKADLDRG